MIEKMKDNGYTSSSLGEVAEYSNGRAFKPSEWCQKGIPIIRIQNLNDINARYNYSDGEFEQKYFVKNGDLLFAWSASLGAYIWKKGDAWLNQHIFRVDRKSCVEKLYLYYFLEKVTKELYAKAHGSGMVHVTKKKFEETKINLPPLPEQRAIVAKLEQLFSELDNGIACLKKAQEQLKVYRQAVLKQAFEGELTKAWREQQTSLPSAQELLDNIKGEREQAAKHQGKKLKPVISLTQAERDDLPDLPDNWMWLKLGELTLGVEYGTSTKSLDNGDVPVIRMGNIQQGRIEWSNLAYTNDKADISKYRLTKGDVLFNRTNSPELVGKTAIYNGEMPAIFAGYLIRINQITVLLDCKYLNFWLNSHPARVYGNSVKTDGVNQSNINGEKLKSYPLPYCSPQEQSQIVQEIETRLSVCDNIESTIRESLEKAEALRQSILKKAFEGKLLSEEELQITRKAPDWEPAEKLLERIRAEKRTARNKH